MGEPVASVSLPYNWPMHSAARFILQSALCKNACQNGAKTQINLATIMLKRLNLTGSTLRPGSVAEKARIARALLENVWPKIEAGLVRPIVHSVFQLQEATAAHRLMEDGGHIGKIVLKVGSS